jgi:hypothetical protein
MRTRYSLATGITRSRKYVMRPQYSSSLTGPASVRGGVVYECAVFTAPAASCGFRADHPQVVLQRWNPGPGGVADHLTDFVDLPVALRALPEQAFGISYIVM